jgi:type I restriction-modification system DNA methylase subunit
MKSKQINSKQRIIEYGEVFTSEREVNNMLDLVKSKTKQIDSRFLEPACGTGNFLVEILRRKLKVIKRKYKNNQLEYERHVFIAISNIYGIDILEDNIQNSRERLFKMFDEQYTQLYKNKCKKILKIQLNFCLIIISLRETL